MLPTNPSNDQSPRSQSSPLLPFFSHPPVCVPLFFACPFFGFLFFLCVRVSFLCACVSALRACIACVACVCVGTTAAVAHRSRHAPPRGLPWQRSGRGRRHAGYGRRGRRGAVGGRGAAGKKYILMVRNIYNMIRNIYT